MGNKFKYSPQERAEIIAKIEALHNQGKSYQEAAREVGIHKGAFHAWKAKGWDKLPGETKIITYDNAPAKRPYVKSKSNKPSTKAFIVFGTPEELAAFAREMQ